MRYAPGSLSGLLARDPGKLAQLHEATLNAGRLYRTLTATLLRFTHGFTYMETRLLPYGRRGFNWSIDPAHWSHFACVCLRQDIVAALGPIRVLARICLKHIFRMIHVTL